MDVTADSGGVLRSIGEGAGSVLAGIPAAIADFLGGAGAGVHGIPDWIAMILGIAMLLSTIKGLKQGRTVAPYCAARSALPLWAGP